jgi:hypothetical protein
MKKAMEFPGGTGRLSAELKEPINMYRPAAEFGLRKSPP